MKKTKVLIVDDERNIQRAYKSYIDSNADRYTLVDMIVNAADAMVVCRTQDVDLILMDIVTAHRENGLKAAESIKQAMPQIKIIMTTSYCDMEAVEEAKRLSADGFWFKDHSDIELVEVMDMAVSGHPYFPDTVPDLMVGDIRLDELTDAEIKVAHALIQYSSIRRIANALYLEESTVKSHLGNICRKVGVHSKTDLAILLSQSKAVLPKRRDYEE